MTERIPWRRVGVEGFVIVASILLAFGIDAWWEERGESERLESSLMSLEAGISVHTARIDTVQRALESRRALLTVFLAADAAHGSDLSSDSLFRVLEAISRPAVFNINGEELISLLETESVQRLDDPAFRGAAAKWRGDWQIVLDRHEALYRHSDSALQALAMHPSTRAAATDVGRGPVLGDDALQVALGDEAIVALAALKRHHLDVLSRLLDRLSGHAQEVAQLAGGLRGG